MLRFSDLAQRELLNFTIIISFYTNKLRNFIDLLLILLDQKKL